MGPQKQHQTARASSGMRPGRYIGRWGRVSGSCGSRAAFSRFLNDVARCPFRGGTAFKASRAGPRNRLSWRYAPRNRREEAATADLTPPAIEQQRCCPRFLNTLSPGKPFTSANCVDPESGFPSIGARAGDRGRSPGCMDGNRGPSRGRI